METPDVSKTPVTDPLLDLILEKLKPILIDWLHSALADEKPAEQNPKFYSRLEVCKLLHISIPTLNRYGARGVIKSHRVGSRVLFSQENITKALTAKNKA